MPTSFKPTSGWSRACWNATPIGIETPTVNGPAGSGGRCFGMGEEMADLRREGMRRGTERRGGAEVFRRRDTNLAGGVY